MREELPCQPDSLRRLLLPPGSLPGNSGKLADVRPLRADEGDTTLSQEFARSRLGTHGDAASGGSGCKAKRRPGADVLVERQQQLAALRGVGGEFARSRKPVDGVAGRKTWPAPIGES